MNIDKWIKKVEDRLKKDEDYVKFELQYIFENTKGKVSDIVCTYADEIIEINPKNMEITRVLDWTYNFDDDFFYELERGKKIVYASPEIHYNLWTTIYYDYPHDIRSQVGLKKYIQYCKENNITKEYLDNENKMPVYDGLGLIRMYEYKNILEDKISKEIEEIKFALVDKDNPNLVTIYVVGDDNKIYTSNFNGMDILSIGSCNFNRFFYNYSLFKNLSENNKILFISDKSNYEIWKEVSQDNYKYDYKKGFIEYLKYCLREDITKSGLEYNFIKDLDDILQSNESLLIEKNELILLKDVTKDVIYSVSAEPLAKEGFFKCKGRYIYYTDDSLSNDYEMRIDIKDMPDMTLKELREYMFDCYEEFMCGYKKCRDENFCVCDTNGIMWEHFIDTSFGSDIPYKILETANKDGRAIALVQIGNKNKEYEIYYDYQVREGKLECKNKYYFNNDLENAFYNFKKMTDTEISKSKKNKERER